MNLNRETVPGSEAEMAGPQVTAAGSRVKLG